MADRIADALSEKAVRKQAKNQVEIIRCKSLIIKVARPTGLEPVTF
jgi:hypothetical protein